MKVFIKYFIGSFLCMVAIESIQAQTHEHAPMSYEIRHRGRIYWQMPRRVIEEIGVREGMQVADIACGDGYFTLLLAEKVGPVGHVYAEDIDRNALRILEDRRKAAGVDNMSIIHGNSNDPMLPENTIQLALIVNSIHLIEDLETLFTHIRRSLTPDGKLVIIQWAAEKMEPEMPGWDAQDRELYTLETSLRRITGARFNVVRQLDFLPMQYIFICRPAR